jgi:hypothetical protein
VARVEVANAATEDLDELIRTHSLPRETRDGPWRWMIFVCVYLEDEDRVAVVSVHDARSSRSPTSQR